MTQAPHQVLHMNVFRAVENGVWLVRCANTGVSCFIDPRGRVATRVLDAEGRDLFVRGVLTHDIIPSGQETFYARYGDWFALLCALVSGGFWLLAWRREAWKKD